jgi:hypothetical protein
VGSWTVCPSLGSALGMEDLPDPGFVLALDWPYGRKPAKLQFASKTKPQTPSFRTRLFQSEGCRKLRPRELRWPYVDRWWLRWPDTVELTYFWSIFSRFWVVLDL